MSAVVESLLYVSFGSFLFLFGIGAVRGLREMRRRYHEEAAVLDKTERRLIVRRFRNVTAFLAYCLYLLFPVVFLVMGPGIVLLVISELPIDSTYRVVLFTAWGAGMVGLHRALTPHYPAIMAFLARFKGFTGYR